MPPPTVVIQCKRSGTECAGALRWREPRERAMHAMAVVVVPECLQLSRRIVPTSEGSEAAGEDIDDHPHPMTVQEDRFAAEEVDTPEANLRLSDESPPGRAGGARVAWAVVFGGHAPNDVLVDLDPEGPSDQLGDAHAAKAWIATLQRDDAATAWTPPGRRSFARVISRWMARMRISRTGRTVP